MEILTKHPHDYEHLLHRLHEITGILTRAVFFFYRPVLFMLIGIDTAVLALAVILVSYVDRSGRVVDHIARFWARLNLFLSGVRVHVQGADRVEPGRSCVVMSNHQSHYDVLAAIGYLPLRLRWVMKIELRKIPFFGLGCERMGHIYIDRGDSEKSHRSLEVAGEKIRAGASVVFFPEGTRSPDGHLLPFKKGGFVIALTAGVPILPVTINGGRKILPKHCVQVLPGTIDVIIHDPIGMEGYTIADKELLMQRVRRTIEYDLVL